MTFYEIIRYYLVDTDFKQNYLIFRNRTDIFHPKSITFIIRPYNFKSNFIHSYL